ncbi:thioredoxin domain-containing protein [Streptomyces bathyalis]|uniref:Thioredoxin domain-containing protein n=2 Tax=Streptomyces bathyalis TaxID=2710756 RepID=A0A7T1WVU2_9ACTN|nr:thioredoxin domain-containing protein [Streptomyces bathyalis]
MRAEQLRRRTTEKRGRQFKVAGVVVAVLAVGAGVGALVAQQTSGNGSADAKPIAVGKPGAPAKLTVYEDFRCPACGQFEKQFSPTIRALEKKGKLRTEYHLVTIIDDNVGGKGSHRAANAAACARDEGTFRRFHDVLYRNQPPEQNDAFSSRQRLIELAGKAGVKGSGFRDCVTGGTHDGWVKKTGDAFKKSGHQSTPTVLLDGENIYSSSEPLTPASLKQKVLAKS